MSLVAGDVEALPQLLAYFVEVGDDGSGVVDLVTQRFQAYWGVDDLYGRFPDGWIDRQEWEFALAYMSHICQHFEELNQR